MSLSSIFFSTMFCLLATSMLMVTAAPTQQHCNKLHAAFVFRNTYFFIFGDNGYMDGFNQSGDTVYRGHAHDIAFPWAVTAAVGVPNHDMFYLIADKYEEGFNDFSTQSTFKVMEWSRAEEKLRQNPHYQGIDAAAMTGRSNILYFAGCQYVEINPYNLHLVTTGEMKDIDLPCDVDAAFKSPAQDMTTIIKGQDVFLFNATVHHVVAKKSMNEDLPFLHSLDLC